LRFFKQGDSLAISLPESVRARTGVKDGDEYEFLLLEPGLFVLASRTALEQRVRSSLVAELTSRMAPAQAGAPQQAKSYVQLPETITSPITAKEAKDTLATRGFLIVENENIAKGLSKDLEKDIKEGRVVGVRGFDKKFYIVASDYYAKASQAVAKALAKGDKSSAEVAKLAGCEENACVSVLQVMKDFGEVIEKKRGVYALIT